MPPTFLFLLYKIIKEQTILKPSKTLNAQPVRSQSLKPSKPSGPSSPNLVCAPSLRCRVSRSHRSVCQPVFLKKFTNLTAVLSSTHQPDKSPINAADITNSNITVKLFMSTPRTHQPVACDAAALVVSLYTSH